VQQQPVRELMTAQVTTLQPDATFKAVVRALEDCRIDAAPVVDAGGELLGVVSESDLTCHEETPASWGALLLGGRETRTHARKSRGRTARELMTSPAVTVGPDATICEALALMGKRKVGRLVVVEDGRMVGILTRSDLLRQFLRADEDILRDVEAAVEPVLRGSQSRLEVEVVEGVVRLHGWVERTSCAWAALAAASEVAGVVDVEDDLLSDVDDTVVHELSMRGPFA
jgi:CBS-domain-containing membrane protein